jgi:hypothetical protein
MNETLKNLKYVDPKNNKPYDFENIDKRVDELLLKDYYTLVDYNFHALSNGWKIWHAERLADGFAPIIKRPKAFIINDLLNKWFELGAGILNQIEDETLKIMYEYNDNLERNIKLNIAPIPQEFLGKIFVQLMESSIFGYALAKAEYELDCKR